MKVYIRKRCDRCHGHGEIDCRYCGGDGYIEEEEDEG